MPSSDLLRELVLNRNNCTGCGGCAGMCPYIRPTSDGVRVIVPCGLEDGRCTRVCPRVKLDVALLDDQVFGGERQDFVLGHYQSISYARAGRPAVQERGQYGGTASALVTAALEAGLIDRALLTGRHGVHPVPKIAKTAGQVLDCAGSRYTACPTLAEANRGDDVPVSLGVVGRPCQVASLRLNQAVDASMAGKAAILIGLFCFWALEDAFFRFLEQRVSLRDVTGVDIPSDLVARTATREVHVSIDEIRPFIRPACLVCADSTAEWADLAVGSTEHINGWNTLVVRTGQGEELVREALRMGLLELAPCPPERVDLLRIAVANKKQRVLERWRQGDPATRYLQLSQRYASAWEGGAKE